MTTLNLTDVAAVRRAVERICETSKMHYVWLPHGDNQPRTCHATKTVYLPSPLPTWGKHELKMLRAYIYHEVGHHHNSQQAMVDLMQKEGLSYEGDFGCTLNCLVDLWQEQITSTNYLGAAEDLAYTQAHWAKEMCKMLDANSATGKPTDTPATRLFGLVYQARSEWQDFVGLTLQSIKGHVDTRHLSHLVGRCNNIINHPTPAAEVVAIAREIFDADPETPNGAEAEQQCKDETEQQQQRQEQSDKGDGEEDKSGSSAADESGDDEGGDAVISYKDILMDDHTDTSPGDPNGGLKINYDHEPAYDYEPYPLDRWYIGDPRLYHRCRESDANSHMDKYQDHKHIANALRRLFQSTSQTRKQYQRERGKLTAKHLPRVLNGDPRIFNRKVDRIDDTADVYLLIDGSGSMQGSRYYAATTAALSMCSALSAAHIPSRVCVFSDYYENCHFEIKDWDERFNLELMCEKFSTVPHGGNADGDNILQAMREMRKRKTKRKVLIVLSDGQPASGMPGDCHTFTQQVVANCSQSGIECYGIGIETNTVEDIYPQHTILNSDKELLETLSDVIKTKIIRS